MFSNSHDQDICAELRHDIVSSYDSNMITNTTMDNTKSLPKSKFEMIIWKFQLLFMKLRNKVSREFFAIDEKTKQKKCRRRATFLLQHEFTLSHNSVIINAQIRAAGGHSVWRMYCCYNYNMFSNYHPFSSRGYIMEIYITFLSVDEILWSMSPFKINLLGSSFAWCYLFLVCNKME